MVAAAKLGFVELKVAFASRKLFIAKAKLMIVELKLGFTVSFLFYETAKFVNQLAFQTVKPNQAARWRDEIESAFLRIV